jgi:hypothetical protein
LKRFILSWKSISSLADDSGNWADPNFVRRLESPEVMISDLSVQKAYNYAWKASRQSFQHSTEQLRLVLKRCFLPNHVLTSATCSKRVWAELREKASRDDFELAALCHASENSSFYIYFDDEDLELARLVLPADKLVQLQDF